MKRILTWLILVAGTVFDPPLLVSFAFSVVRALFFVLKGELLFSGDYLDSAGWPICVDLLILLSYLSYLATVGFSANFDKDSDCGLFFLSGE